MKMAKRLTYGDGDSGFRFVWEGGTYIDVFYRGLAVNTINTTSTEETVPDFNVNNMMSEVRKFLSDPSNVSDIKENA
jgi:hypothetical protein